MRVPTLCPVKPVSNFWQRWRDLSVEIQSRGQGGQCRVSVVGGGAGGVEIAMAMANRFGASAAIDLWCAAPTILEAYNARARAGVMSALARHSISVHVNARVAAVTADALELEGGSVAPYDALFWCTGASPGCLDCGEWSTGRCARISRRARYLAVHR